MGPLHRSLWRAGSLSSHKDFQHKQQNQEQSQPDSLSTSCLKRSDKKPNDVIFQREIRQSSTDQVISKCTSAHTAQYCTWKQLRVLQLWRTDDCLPSALLSDIRKLCKKYSEAPNTASIPAPVAVSSLLWQDRYSSKINCSSHHSALPACKILHSPKGIKFVDPKTTFLRNPRIGRQRILMFSGFNICTPSTLENRQTKTTKTSILKPWNCRKSYKSSL